MKGFIIICLLICAAGLSAQETEKPTLLVKESKAETSFPAFNRQVADENGITNIQRVWQNELPTLDVKIHGEARYVVSVCARSVECWQVGLRSPQQEILLTKVVSQVQVDEAGGQKNLMAEKVIGYAISETAQEEKLKFLLDAWQNSLLVAARIFNQKLNPSPTAQLLKLMFADEKEYITVNYGSMGMFAALVPNPIREIQIYKTPNLPRLYLSSHPPMLKFEVKGIDSYGDEAIIDTRKLRFFIHDGKSQKLLPRPEFKPWRVGQFSVRAVYPGVKERDIESTPMPIDVTRVEELMIAPAEVELSPQESYTFVVGGRGSEGQELTMSDLEYELEWKIEPIDVADMEEKGVVKAGVNPGTCRLTIFAKSNPQVQATAQISIRDKK